MSYSRAAYRRTTIGAAAFHFRVRNGNGWDHCASITRSEARKIRDSLLARESRSVKALHRKHSVRFTILDLTIHVQIFKEPADSLISTYRKCRSNFLGFVLF